MIISKVGKFTNIMLIEIFLLFIYYYYYKLLNINLKNSLKCSETKMGI